MKKFIEAEFSAQNAADPNEPKQLQTEPTTAYRARLSEYRNARNQSQRQQPQLPRALSLEKTPERMPTSAETAQLDADWNEFTRRHPSLIVNKDNASVIVGALTRNGATASLANLENVYSEILTDLYFSIEGRVVRGSQLTADEQARVMSGEPDEARRVDAIPADGYLAEFVAPSFDTTPEVILKKIEKAIVEFRTHPDCRDYNGSPEHRKCMDIWLELHASNGKPLDVSNPGTYISGWRWLKANGVVPAGPYDAVTLRSGQPIGRTNPVREPGDPTFNISPELRALIRKMSSTEFYEWKAQNPKLAAKLDEGY